MTAPSITLITGGCRSGKSRFALELAGRRHHRAFIATATACDQEMHSRIRQHQEDRGQQFHTIEEPTKLALALRRIPAPTEVAVVDCLTVWAGNLMHLHGDGDPQDCREVAAFLNELRKPPCDLLIVTNEVGMGIVPENRLARRFRDLAGMINQQVAELADCVVMMVCGYPIAVKGNLPK